VRRVGARLVVIDVLAAYLSGRVDSYKDADIRRALAPLKRMAEDLGCAVVVLRHLVKARGGNALHAGGGSIGIGGAARSVLLVANDPTDESRRVLAVTKCNIAAKAPSLGFRLVSTEPLDVVSPVTT